MAFEFRCTMPCDFTMYVVAIVLPSKCLGHFAKRINKLKGRSKQRDASFFGHDRAISRSRR